MGYRIIGAGLLGWGAIVALAWRMADQRILICGDRSYNKACIIGATSDRDFVLAFGLTVALVVIVGAALVYARRTQWLSSGFPSASRAHRLQADR